MSPMKLTYRAQRYLQESATSMKRTLAGQISGCEKCQFGKRDIALCDYHAQALDYIMSVYPGKQ